MSYWYKQLTKIKGNEQCLQWLENELNIFANSALLGNREFLDDWDFLNSNDLSVEDFWMVLYFQTLPYALWRLVSTTCSLVSRDIFEHGFHGWFFDSLNV
ncbi:unnamed protein product [Rhizophagus irregularis]|nr:unnamed protein product [Rhizophagus irregularis]